MNQEEYKELLENLKALLDPAKVKVSSFFPQGVFLTCKNDFTVFITSLVDPSEEDGRRGSMSTNNVKIVVDPELKCLRKLAAGKETSRNTEEASFFLKSIINSLSKNPSNIDQTYFDLHDYKLKEMFSAFHNLSYNPSREIFLYGNDEFRLRFSPYLDIEVPKEGLEVEIIDSSAYILGEGKDRNIDLLTGINSYKLGDRLYLGKNLTEEVPATKEDCHTVSYNSKDKSKKYFKSVLKKGVDLSKEKSVLCLSANRKIFTLLPKGKKLVLKDSEGIIEISHPDMLVYLR